VGTASNVGTQVPADSEADRETPAYAKSAQPSQGGTSGAPAYEPAAAQVPVQSSAQQAPQSAPAPASTQAGNWAAVPAAAAEVTGNAPGKQSLYQRLSNSPEAMAGRIQVPARAAAATATMVEDVPSADDETIEESGVFGRAAVERILGGRLLEERSLDGTPLMRR
jgi:DNA polymerase-3 subunit gamma/tau